MKLLTGSLAYLTAATTLLAVYAPIPSQEQGEALSGSIASGVYYDSNIFGSQDGRISSVVGQIAPHVDYNHSLSDQTFFSANYDLQVLIFENRPGSDDVLANNFLNARIDHTFSPTLFASISDNFSYTMNPESAVIAGQPLQTDQSYFYNQVEAEALWNITEKWSLEGVFRNQFWFYDDNQLADELDRVQWATGAEVGYLFLPELTIVGEYRFEYDDYTDNSPPKSSFSNYFLAGADYNMTERFLVQARVGAEYRIRESNPDRTSPYGELTLLYLLTERSYVSGGLVYGIFETSDTSSFLDQENLDLNLNFEYFVFPKIALSGSLTYQYAQMNGRGFTPDANEYTYRAGVGVSYLITDNWAAWIDYDYDLVDSQVPGRNQVRNRVGGYVRYTF